MLKLSKGNYYILPITEDFAGAHMEEETKDCSSSGYIITFMKTYTTKSI